MFYHHDMTSFVMLSVVASTLFFAGACKGGGIKAGESNRLNKLVRKASSVVGLELDSLEVVVESRMRDKFHTRARACVRDQWASVFSFTLCLHCISGT